MATNLALQLHARGIRSSVLALDEGGEHLEELQRAGVECTVLGGRRPWSPSFHREIASVLRRSDAEVAHTHHFAPLLHSLAGRHLARVPRLVHTEHSYAYLTDRPDYRLALRTLAMECDAFVLCGERMEPFYRDRVGIPGGRVRIIPNGIDTVAFHPLEDRDRARESLGLPGGVLVGAAARLAPEKNFALLVRAFAIAHASRPELSLVLAGDGAERVALEALADSLGVHDAVRFLGWRADVELVVAALDVFVVSSLREALPLAVLESMSCGVTVVSTPVGDIPEVVHDGVSGLLVPPGDERALAAALIALASDPQRRIAMGRQARQAILARYSIDAMVDEYLRAYGRDSRVDANEVDVRHGESAGAH